MAKVHGLLNEYVTQERLPYKLNAPSPTERGELAVLSEFNEFCADHGQPFELTIGRVRLKHVVGINKIEGTPKADLAIVTWDKSRRVLQNSYFLSHKMGLQAKDFQQYSGITPKADGKRPGSISKDKNVVAFLRAISQPGIMAKIVKKKERFYRDIKDGTLIGKAVYGPEYGGSSRTEDNIHAIAQGEVDIEWVNRSPGSGKEAWAELGFSAGVVHENGETAPFMRDPYRAVIGARYTEGRNFQVDGKNFNNVRVLILPLVVLGGNSQKI